MANIKDIAKMANVSVTTVSRVLNNHPYVSQEKRNAVLQAIEKSNYQKNYNAVHLSTGKTFLIGVVLPYSNHPYFGLLVEGIANEALTLNYNIVLIQTNYDKNRELEALDMLKHKQIDALIICSRICDWDTLKHYSSYGSITLCEDTRGRNLSSTFIDHYESFFTALEFLASKGHSKIGYCIGRTSGTNSTQRESAYRDFLQKYNHPYEVHYIFNNCLFLEDGEQVIKEIKKMTDPPTAILVTSDQVAAGMVTCCHKENISIPNKLALIGFDNQPIAKLMAITTMEIPLVQMGRNLVIQATNSKDTTYDQFKSRLIERETV
ncbi:LacI family DNA-binding transcriptional regulator [Halalkalibacter alkalisediminis]|uniref:LacI family DNA-binding transcriptional regulator n=1 Tax=Halalkalibacter alkalisediminis TaxID=935616 RepID=A0ABV6NNT4_9BACI|nr:LacI family DNA-binding transcriptional regulator [Halalkalibacter alkalisediminis]